MGSGTICVRPLLNDKLVLPTQADGMQWDFGALEFGMVNPNIPK